MKYECTCSGLVMPGRSRPCPGCLRNRRSLSLACELIAAHERGRAPYRELIKSAQSMVWDDLPFADQQESLYKALRGL